MGGSGTSQWVDCSTFMEMLFVDSDMTEGFCYGCAFTEVLDGDYVMTGGLLVTRLLMGMRLGLYFGSKLYWVFNLYSYDSVLQPLVVALSMLFSLYAT